MINKKIMKKLFPIQKTLYFYIENSTDFPITIKKISQELGVSRQSVSAGIQLLLEYDLIDVIEYKTHKEIFKKGYLFDDEI